MPKWTRLNWLLEAISLGLVVFIFIDLAAHWTELPGRVPHHFNLAGEPNAWGGKGYLLVTPLAALALYGLLTAAGSLGRGINLPFAINRELPEVRLILLNMSEFLKAAMLLTFAYINWMSINVAQGRGQGLGAAFLPILLVGNVGPLIYFLARLSRYRT